MESIFKEIINLSNSWATFKSFMDEKSNISGKLFELFTKYYFMIHPKEKDNYKNVWLFNEIPTEIKEKLKTGNVDYGVDILLEDYNGNYSSVQCKYRSDETSKLSWSKDKISNFFAFIPNVHTFILFSNVFDLDNISKTRHENFMFYNIHDLLDIKEEFFIILKEYFETNKIKEFTKYIPKEHQKKAVENAIKYYENNDRGQLIFPCGAGKTITSLWIKEALNCKNTIVLVPSLTLLRQFKNQWIEQRKVKYNYLCVCSEKDIDKSTDNFFINTYEIDSNVTTKPDEIFNFIENNTNKVIFSTYQSFNKICEAVKDKNIEFDLIISDEAHRTAGEESKMFALIHKNENVFSKKRLYMTATPRVVSQSLKNKLGDEDLLYDMSDVSVYGKEFFRMSFKEAIDKEILVDYQIIVIGVSDKDIQKHIKNKKYITEKESIDEIANNFAIDMVMREYDASHAITFHSRVKYAKSFVNMQKNIFKKEYFCENVNGEQSSSERAIIFDKFKKSNKGILTNARCLTEGIDIPSIDIVYFCDPKNSKIDIVQAAGRALRIDIKNNKKKGLIVVPIYHKEKDLIEGEIETSYFNNVIQVIRALADNDERLQDEITQLIYNKECIGNSNSIIEFMNNSEVILLKNFEDKLKKTLFTQIIEKTVINWDVIYLKLMDYLTNNNYEYPNKEQNEFLSSWVSAQRTRYNKGLLSTYRVDKLNKLNFIWDFQEYKWNENFQLLLEFRKNNPDKWPSQRSTEEIEHKLAVWFLQIRKEYRENLLSEYKYKKLNDIVFPFDAMDGIWKNTYNKLVEWLENNENYPTSNNKDKDENNLNNWCKRQKEDYLNNKLSDENKKLLDFIDFIDFINDRKKTWDEIFEELKEYVKLNNKFPSYDTRNRGKYSKEIQFLGNWVIRQRIVFKNKKLTKQQINKLKSINFIFYNKENDEIFEDNLNKLKEFRKNNPDKWPSYSTPNREEYKLAQWVNHLRQIQKGNLKTYNKLPEYKLQLLDSIGFEWEVRIREEYSWDENYEELKKQLLNKTFKSEFNRKQNPVYSWLYKQKIKYQNNELEQEYIDKLELLSELGFEWNINKNVNKEWDEYYEQLKEQIANNTFKSTFNGKPNPIYKWVLRQKDKYKQGKLEQEYIDKLKLLGIDFEDR